MHIHIYSMVAMSRVIYHPPPPCSLVPAKPRSSYTTHALDSQATGQPLFLICKQNDNCARRGWETRDTEDTPWLGLYSERQSHPCGRVECRMVFLVPRSHTPSGHTTSLCRSRRIVASLINSWVHEWVVFAIRNGWKAFSLLYSEHQLVFLNTKDRVVAIF